MPRRKNTPKMRSVEVVEEYEEEEEDADEMAVYTAPLDDIEGGETGCGKLEQVTIVDVHEVEDSDPDDYDPTEDTSDEDDSKDDGDDSDEDFVPGQTARAKKSPWKGSKGKHPISKKCMVSGNTEEQLPPEPASPPEDMFKNIAMKALQNVNSKQGQLTLNLMAPGGIGLGEINLTRKAGPGRITCGPGRVVPANAMKLASTSGPGSVDALQGNVNVNSGPGRVDIGALAVKTGPGRISTAGGTLLEEQVKRSGPGRIVTGPGRIDLANAIAVRKEPTEKNQRPLLSGTAVSMKKEPLSNEYDAEAVQADGKLNWKEIPNIAPSVSLKKGPYECPLCKKKFSVRSGYYMHLRKQYMCEVCDEKFHTRELLTIHRFQIHKIKCEKEAVKIVQDDKYVKVYFKGEGATDDQTGNEPTSHRPAEKRKRGRPTLAESFDRSKQMEDFEIEAKKTQISADDILKQGQADTEEEIEEQQQLIAEPPVEGGVSTYFSCEICGYVYMTQEKLNWHKRRKHPTTFTLRTFKCDLCSERFYTNEEFKMHLQATGHTKPKKGQHPYLCQICNLTFPSMAYLETHIQNHIPAEVNNFCNICGFQAPDGQEGSLVKHFEEAHTNTGALNKKPSTPEKVRNQTPHSRARRGRPKGSRNKKQRR